MQCVVIIRIFYPFYLTLCGDAVLHCGVRALWSMLFLCSFMMCLGAYPFQPDKRELERHAYQFCILAASHSNYPSVSCIYCTVSDYLQAIVWSIILTEAVPSIQIWHSHLFLFPNLIIYNSDD